MGARFHCIFRHDVAFVRCNAGSVGNGTARGRLRRDARRPVPARTGPHQMATARTSPRMAEQTEQEPESVAVESETRVKGLEARSTSWLSRNLSEERRNQRTFYDIEKRGELLKAPDRAADGAWGEELTEIGKWQRTNGPIYIQATGGLMLVAGFANYFGAANANGLSQPLWCTSILVALLGFALQRKGGD